MKMKMKFGGIINFIPMNAHRLIDNRANDDGYTMFNLVKLRNYYLCQLLQQLNALLL